MAALTPAGPDAIGRAAHTQWLGWPDRAGTRWPALQGVAGDGYFLLTIPLLAAILPVLALVGGFLTGFARLGYEQVYTESLTVMVAAVALGAFSGQLGALAVVGFAAGDAISSLSTDPPAGTRVGDPTFADVVVDRVLPLLITYLLLATVVVVLPRAARQLTGAVGRERRIPLAIVWPLTGALVVLVLWIAVSAWAAGAPTLIRPIFTFPGTNPTVAAIEPLQQHGGWLVAAGIVGAMLRHGWIGVTLVPGPWRERLREAEDLPTGAVERPAASGGLARVVAADVVFAALATLCLAGVLEFAWSWIVTFAVLLVVRVLRSPLVRWPVLDGWKRLTARAPAWLRLVVVWLIGRLVIDAVSQEVITSYTGLAMFVLGGVLLAFVVFPGQPSDRAAAR